MWPNAHFRVLSLANQWAGFNVWSTNTYRITGSEKAVKASLARKAAACYLREKGFTFDHIADVISISKTVVERYCEPRAKRECSEALEWMRKEMDNPSA